MATLNPCRTCGQPPVIDDGSDYTVSIGCIPCDSWTSRYGLYDDKHGLYMEWNEGNPVGNPAPGIDYASMTPKERHAYCVAWLRGLGLSDTVYTTNVASGISVNHIDTGYWLIEVVRKSSNVCIGVCDNFSSSDEVEIIPAFAIIRAIERGELR